MSVFDKVAHFFTGAVNTVIEGAKDAWDAIRTVWAFLVSIARLADGAWEWVVNGVNWFTGMLEGWVSEIYHAIEHTLFTVIPEAATWALKHAIGWAIKLVDELDKWIKTALENVRKWIDARVNDVIHFFKGLYHTLLSWVKGPIEWVIHNAERVAELLFHPDRLAKYIVGHLVIPLIQWLLKSSLPVFAWLLRGFVSEESEIAHLAEDFLTKVL